MPGAIVMDKKIKIYYQQIKKLDKSKSYHHSMNFSASYFFTLDVLQGYLIINRILSINFKPSFDYYEWEEFMDRKGVYEKLPSVGIILRESLRLLRNGIILSGLMLTLSPYFPLSQMISEE